HRGALGGAAAGGRPRAQLIGIGGRWPRTLDHEKQIMNINFIYDPSVSSAPAAFKTALNTVAQEVSQIFTDPITINIRVGWGEFAGNPVPSTALGETDISTLAHGAIGLTYAQLKTDLMQHATSMEDVFAINNLPVSDPTGGNLIY